MHGVGHAPISETKEVRSGGKHDGLRRTGEEGGLLANREMKVCGGTMGEVIRAPYLTSPISELAMEDRTLGELDTEGEADTGDGLGVGPVKRRSNVWVQPTRFANINKILYCD